MKRSEFAVTRQRGRLFDSVEIGQLQEAAVRHRIAHTVRAGLKLPCGDAEGESPEEIQAIQNRSAIRSAGVGALLAFVANTDFLKNVQPGRRVMSYQCARLPVVNNFCAPKVL